MRRGNQHQCRGSADGIAQRLLPVWRAGEEIALVDPDRNALSPQVGAQLRNRRNITLRVRQVDPGLLGWFLIVVRREGDDLGAARAARPARRRDEDRAIPLGEHQRIRQPPHRITIGQAAGALQIEDAAGTEAGALGQLLLGEPGGSAVAPQQLGEGR